MMCIKDDMRHSITCSSIPHQWNGILYFNVQQWDKITNTSTNSQYKRCSVLIEKYAISLQQLIYLNSILNWTFNIFGMLIGEWNFLRKNGYRTIQCWRIIIIIIIFLYLNWVWKYGILLEDMWFMPNSLEKKISSTESSIK